MFECADVSKLVCLPRYDRLSELCSAVNGLSEDARSHAEKLQKPITQIFDFEDLVAPKN